MGVGSVGSCTIIVGEHHSLSFIHVLALAMSVSELH